MLKDTLLQPILTIIHLYFLYILLFQVQAQAQMVCECGRLCKHGEGLYWIQLSQCGICLQSEWPWSKFYQQKYSVFDLNCIHNSACAISNNFYVKRKYLNLLHRLP